MIEDKLSEFSANLREKARILGRENSLEPIRNQVAEIKAYINTLPDSDQIIGNTFVTKRELEMAIELTEIALDQYEKDECNHYKVTTTIYYFCNTLNY